MSTQVRTATTRSRLIVAALVAIVCAGAAAIGEMAQRGSPLSHDSFRYLAGAESIAATGTYRGVGGSVETHYPPGVSLLYAAGMKLTGRPATDLVLPLNVVAYAAVAAIWWMLLRWLGISRGISALAVAAISLNTAWVAALTKLWSEPFASVCIALVLYATIRALAASPAGLTRAAIRWFLVATVLAGAGVLFRWALISLIVVPAAAAMFALRRSPGRAVGAAATIGILACLPTLVVMQLLGVSLWQRPPRMIQWNPWSPARDAQGWTAFADQFVPARAGWVAALLGTLALSLVIVALRNGGSDRLRKAIATLAFFIAAYVALVWGAERIADAALSMELRILLPLMPSVVAILAASISLLDAGTGRWHRAVGAGTLAILFIAAARGGRALALSVLQEPAAAACADDARVIAAIRDLLPRSDAPVLTNSVGIVWFALRRPALSPPTEADPEFAVFIDGNAVCRPPDLGSVTREQLGGSGWRTRDGVSVATR